MRKGFAHGFTLIELLVVIAIIAILAAILFPVFARARAKAQQNDCLSNLKQIQLSMIMYSSDNNSRYPLDVIGMSTPNGPSWPSEVLPYIKNVQIYLCPTDAVITGTVTGAGLPGVGNTVTTMSYGRNSYPSIGGNPGTYTVPLSDALINYPAEMLGVIDAVTYSIPTDYAYNSPTPTGSLAATQNAIILNGSTTLAAARHNSGCNQSYMDGHCKWIAFTNIPDPTVLTAGSANRHYWYGID
jgi:prepilin-type N-terminal cleavage/methylation domain-containing protein/prepilin-type processing-associated H-X9-DG protein